MKRFLVLLAVVGFMAAACSHAVKQSPQQAVQAAPAPKVVKPASAPASAPALKPAATAPVSESAEAAAIAAAEKVGDIHFAFDKYALNADAKTKLKDLSAILMKNSGLKVLVEGRCDERGTEEYNLALGDKRASAAKNYLVALGVEGGRISTVSYGKDKPLCTEHNEKCWAINRSDRFAVSK